VTDRTDQAAWVAQFLLRPTPVRRGLLSIFGGAGNRIRGSAARPSLRDAGATAYFNVTMVASTEITTRGAGGAARKAVRH